MEALEYNAAVESYMEGSLTEDQAEALLAGFGADAKVKERFVEDVRWAGLLSGVAALETDPERLVRGVLDSVSAEGDGPDVSQHVVDFLTTDPSGGTRRNAKWVPLAAALTLALGALFWSRGTSEDAIARVGLASEVEWKSSGSFATGDSVGAEVVALDAGLVRLDFPTGVRVTLEGPAILDIVSDSEVRLREGELTARVPPEGVGFRVHTDQAEVIDLGTTFGVAVNQGGETDVRVYEGEVELVTPDGPRGGQLLQQGQQGTVMSQQAPVVTEGFASEVSSRGWEVLFGVYNMEGTIRFVNQEAIRDPLEIVDPNHIVVFPERIGTQLTGQVEVTLRQPGTYDAHALMTQQRVMKGRGGRVDTYLVQCNASGNPQEREATHFDGSVTFERPILAVISASSQLDATDLYLGKRRFTYPTDDVRGLEHGDTLSLSDDRHTLTIHWETVHRFDQIRVIVDSDGE